MDIGVRRKYFLEDTITLDEILKNPYDQFEIWFNDACRAGIDIPNMMTLTTINQDGFPNSRSVLLRKIERDGFTFFTNSHSQKNRDIAQNSKVALHFSWDSISRQVSISGELEKVSRSEARKFFNGCSRSLKLSFWLPTIEDNNIEILEEKLRELQHKFDGTQIPMPQNWIGYRIVPIIFEFWQGKENYIHDRFQYTLDSDNSWQVQRLLP